jgi:hypothetical protein
MLTQKKAPEGAIFLRGLEIKMAFSSQRITGLSFVM